MARYDHFAFAYDTICFDDVLLKPQYSSIPSRDDIMIGSDLPRGFGHLYLPVIAAPMTTVCEDEMCNALGDCGGMGIIHRYNTIEEQAEIIKKVTVPLYGVAVGATGDYLRRVASAYNLGTRIFLIDVAHGHHDNVKNAIEKMRSGFGDKILIIAGNVATADAAEFLYKAGADIIRVGIGGGSVCTTRVVTGHGLPTLESVCRVKISRSDAPIIADGGIRNSGDAVKALAAGASFVMLGSVLAGTNECPNGGTWNGKIVYEGMASNVAQHRRKKPGDKDPQYIEGTTAMIDPKGSVAGVMKPFAARIRSGLSYSGARTVKELYECHEFVKVSSATQQENKPHGA